MNRKPYKTGPALRTPAGRVRTRLVSRLEDHLDVQAAKKALEEARVKGTIPWKKVKKELGL